MSLRKKSTITEKSTAARRANGSRSHGPVTAQGRTRIRETKTRHGFYSQGEALALACLGEDPDELQRLRMRLYADMQVPTALHEELAEHLVQVLWRWKRAGRMQEGYALRLAKDANLTRDDRLHGQMMRLSITADTLRQLAQSVAREDYVTCRTDLEMMKNLRQEGAVKEMGEIAVALFYRLQAPGTGEDGVDPEEKTRRVVTKIRAIFGLSTNKQFFEDREKKAQTLSEESQQGAGPAEAEEEEEVEEISPEEEARERARQLLENILTRQVELCEAKRKAILKESLASPSAYEQAAEFALAHPEAALMQRMEESSFRQIWRITNLLLKVKHHAHAEESR